MSDNSWLDAYPIAEAPAPSAAAGPAPTPPAATAAPAAGLDHSWLNAYPVAEKASASPASTPSASAATQSPAEPRGFMSELARQGGLTARAAVNGLAAIPAMMSDAVTGPINAGLDAVRGEGQGFRFKSAGASMNDLMTRAGVPEPATAQERVVQDVASALTGTGATVGAGRLMARGFGAMSPAASTATQAVGQGLAAGPKTQAAATLAGSTASGTVREEGGGAGAQLAAGLAAGVAPTVAPAALSGSIRRALRGGEEGRQRMVENIKTFQDASGTMPSVGQASESRAARAIESGLAKFPGGAGPMNRFAQAQSDALAGRVQKLSDELAPGANSIMAGEAVTRGVNSFKQGFKAIQTRLYQSLDKHIPDDTPIPVGNTEFALKELTAGIEGAPNISQFFINSKIKGIDKALQADLELASTGGALPYESIKKLRTLVGHEMADNSLVADVPRRQWSALYGALSEDLGMAAKAAGPDAEGAWKWANNFTRAQMDRLDQLSSVVGKDTPEKVFSAAIAGTSEGDTMLKRVVSALPKGERRQLAAAVLQRLGRATPGQQNAMGDVFSSETFLTNLSKMSPEARSTLFGRAGVDDLERRIENMAKMAGNRREGGKVFSNPSGTGQAVSQVGVPAAIGAALVSGNPGALAAAVGAPVMANATARTFTSPTFVQKLAQKTEFNPAAPASTAGVIARLAERREQEKEEGRLSGR